MDTNEGSASVADLADDAARKPQVIHLIYKQHLDDYHADVSSEHDTLDGVRAELTEATLAGYDVSNIRVDGTDWEHYPYGAQWGPKRKTGWQHCTACDSTHPVGSEC